MEDFSYLTVTIVSFLIGNITGFILARVLAKAPFNLDGEDRINYLIGIVSFVWFISVVVDIVNPHYETSPLIHGIMGAIVGFFFWRPKT